MKKLTRPTNTRITRDTRDCPRRSARTVPIFTDSRQPTAVSFFPTSLFTLLTSLFNRPLPIPIQNLTQPKTKRLRSRGRIPMRTPIMRPPQNRLRTHAKMFSNLFRGNPFLSHIYCVLCCHLSLLSSLDLNVSRFCTIVNTFFPITVPHEIVKGIYN